MKEIVAKRNASAVNSFCVIVSYSRYNRSLFTAKMKSNQNSSTSLKKGTATPPKFSTAFISAWER